MQKNKERELILIILTTIIFILLAMNSLVFFNRMDLTKNKTFTISNTTKKIISSIPDKIHITYFISDKIKAITSVALEIEDILYEYAAHSKGRIVVNSMDPVSSGMTSRIESLGITPQQIEVYEKNEQSFIVVYSGIVIQYMDKIETIPFTITLETVEYDVTYRIRKLVEGIDLSLGVLIGDSKKNLQDHYSYLNDILERTYKIEVIKPGQEIPSSISVLAVIGNKDLTDGDMLYIDEYIMEGGKVLFGIEGVDVDARNLSAVVKLENSPAIEMLKKYGITINNDLVLDKYAKRIPLRGTFPMIYPQWISILGQNVSTENPITSRFSGLDLLWASSISIEEMEGITYEKLLSTTDQAWTLEQHITAAPQEVSSLMGYKGDDQRQITLGYVVSGTFKSAFTDKTSKNTRIIVISDSDFVADIIEFSDSPYNIIFFENAIEWLSNDDSLLQIKTRDRRDLRLNKIEVPEKKIKAIIIVYLVNIVIIPLSIIIFAIVHFIRRKKREA
ncbi:MAG: GldG family protein [Spirochaetaceae bacterium]|nr:GldG family protein [Spirochaetaceae bacterium]